MEPNTESSLFELQVDHNVSAYLGETARWAKFLAIVGFICCGIFVIVAIFANTYIAGTLGSTGERAYLGGLVSFIYIVLGVILFFPSLYLYNFASRMQVALHSNDQEQLTRSFRSLKSCYRFMGILTIIYLGLIVLLVIFNIFGRAARM